MQSLSPLDQLAVDAFATALETCREEGVELPDEVWAIAQSLEDHVEKLSEIAQQHPQLNAAYRTARKLMRREEGDRQKRLATGLRNNDMFVSEGIINLNPITNHPADESSLDRIVTLTSNLNLDSTSSLNNATFVIEGGNLNLDSTSSLNNATFVIEGGNLNLDSTSSLNNATFVIKGGNLNLDSTSNPSKHAMTAGDEQSANFNSLPQLSPIRRFVLPANASDTEQHYFQTYIAELKRLNPKWVVSRDRCNPDESDAYMMIPNNENYQVTYAAYIGSQMIKDLFKDCKL